MAKKQLMTQKEFAEHIGKSPQYVNKLVNDGKIQLVSEHGRKLVDPKQALDAMNAFSKVGKVIKPPTKPKVRKAEKGAKTKPKAAAVKPPKPDSATRQLTKFRTEEQEAVAGMAKLKYAQLRGELLPANDVREAQRMKNQNIKQKFWSLPRSTAETLARLSTPRECEDFLRGEIAKIFDKLVNDSIGMKDESLQTADAVETLRTPDSATSGSLAAAHAMRAEAGL